MKYYLICLGILLTHVLFSQDKKFASDRPGISDAPDLIDKNGWQIATGFDISKYNHYGIYQLSQSTLKYGISSRFEARLDIALQYDHIKNIYGAVPPSIGLKTLLFNQKKLIPKTALIVEYYPAAFGTVQKSSGLGIELCLSNDFKNGSSFYYNFGSNWIDIKAGATLNLLVGFSYAVSKKTALFVELYLYQNPGADINYVTDIGITQLLNKRLQLDFACGLDLVHPDGNYYFDGGITYNF